MWAAWEAPNFCHGGDQDASEGPRDKQERGRTSALGMGFTAWKKVHRPVSGAAEMYTRLCVPVCGWLLGVCFGFA